jgi:hypothetical protein
MELGGNLPEFLIEHLMIASPEASTSSVENETADNFEMNLDAENEPAKTNEIEEKDDEEEDEPLKAEGR